MLTEVVNVRGRDRAELLADPRFVYVGRAVARAGWPGSLWGNPFNRFVTCHFSDTKEQQAATAAEYYRDWLAGDRRLYLVLSDNPKRSRMSRGKAVALRLDILASLPGLRGKKLGCWCCDWRPGEPIVTPCHAIVLAELAEAAREGM